MKNIVLSCHVEIEKNVCTYSINKKLKINEYKTVFYLYMYTN